MRVFISWSGDASKLCAEALRDWLPFMNQAINPFVSSQDISKGERGLDKIANKLQDCTFGIVCVTRDNQHAPWINFEAGALSRELGESMLAPFLLDFAVKDLSGPIAQFQATESGSRDEVWALVKSLNDACETSVDFDRLRVTFDRFWDDLDRSLNEIRSSRPSTASPERETSDILNELVALVREQSSRIHSLDNKVSHFESEAFAARYTINEPGEVRINTSSHDHQHERVRRLRRIIADTIGSEHIVWARNGAAGKADLDIRVSDSGLLAAQGAMEALQSEATRLRASAYIHSADRRAEPVVLAPF
ncbi:TIR domain-containing protein [Streptomyces longwoodensis]|uniref:TIR domain-containing protein n=1 Tax=Streptomyces longwoodensis TaxID=68231 RepID=UPI0037001DDE